MTSHPAASPLRIVSIGGGNGLATLLRGLKRYVRVARGGLELTAIVTVTDDGGSSGRLRRDFDVLPPGDIRNCMVALSPDETLLTKLFNYRFSAGRGLKGHSFGNLFLTAMTDLTGDFAHAVSFSAEVLELAGRIFPSTAAKVGLEATLVDGQIIAGETRIGRSKIAIREVRLSPRRVKPLPQTLAALAQADLITLGPGSLFTSVIPNVLVEGVARAIAESPATKVHFMNLMTQPGETGGYRASDHLEKLLAHCGRHRRAIADVCVVNTGLLGTGAVRAYSAQSAQPVEIDRDRLEALGTRVVAEDLVRLAGRRAQSLKIRHDPGALGAIAVELAQEHRSKLQDKSKRKRAS